MQTKEYTLERAHFLPPPDTCLGASPHKRDAINDASLRITALRRELREIHNLERKVIKRILVENRLINRLRDIW